MKYYVSGLLGFVATIGALVANMQWNQGFHQTHPLFFWGGQALFFLLFVVMSSYTWRHWDNKVLSRKKDLIRTILLAAFLYCIAFVGSADTFLLIFSLGVAESYFTRKSYRSLMLIG